MKDNIRDRKLDLFRFSKMYRFFLLAQKQSSAANLPVIFDEIFIVLKERIFFTRFFSSISSFSSNAFKRFFYYKFYLLLHSKNVFHFFFLVIVISFIFVLILIKSTLIILYLLIGIKLEKFFLQVFY